MSQDLVNLRDNVAVFFLDIICLLPFPGKDSHIFKTSLF